MRKTMGIFLLGFLLLLSCSDKKFNTEKWKASKDDQFFMLNDLIENKRLLGKTKSEIIELLDTVDIKQYNYSDNSWMFIVSKPHSFATERGVEILDVNFENDIVKKVTLRQ